MLPTVLLRTSRSLSGIVDPYSPSSLEMLLVPSIQTLTAHSACLFRALCVSTDCFLLFPHFHCLFRVPSSCCRFGFSRSGPVFTFFLPVLGGVGRTTVVAGPGAPFSPVPLRYRCVLLSDSIVCGFVQRPIVGQFFHPCRLFGSSPSRNFPCVQRYIPVRSRPRQLPRSPLARRYHWAC